MPNQCNKCGAHFLGPWCPHCIIAKLRAQVTQLQEYNNEQVERRRVAEARVVGTSDRLDVLCAQAMERWGKVSQMAMCAEECAELGAEIMRVLRGRKDRVEPMAEEAADVFITVLQVRLLFPAMFEVKLREKLDRLEKLLEASA